MTESQWQADGFAILCNTQGVVLDVPYQTLPIDRQLVPGVSFAFLFHENSIEKAVRFLASAREQDVSEHCSLNISLAGNVLPVFVSSHRTPEGLRIMGALSEPSLIRLCSTLPESAPGLLPLSAAPLLENQDPPAAITPPLDADLFEEFSRLNNEFANAQCGNQRSARVAARHIAEHHGRSRRHRPDGPYQVHKPDGTETYPMDRRPSNWTPIA
jgi:hypothetical protein